MNQLQQKFSSFFTISDKQLFDRSAPINPPSGIAGIANFFKQTTISSTEMAKPVAIKETKNQKNQIFIDIFEKINVLFNNTGFVINNSIDGCIQMKSYLYGNPPLKLALNEDLVIGRGGFNTSGVYLDDCNFHQCCDVSDFDVNKTLKIQPPQGEFTVMNYRVSGEISAPFRLFPIIEETSPYKLELNLKIKACFPKQTMASFVILKFIVPQSASTCHNELEKNAAGQKVDFNEKNNQVEWQIRSFVGEQEKTLKSKISLQTNANAYQARKEFGAINVSFEIPMYNISNLQIKYMKIEETSKNVTPQRWVRYVTQSSSYVCRI